MNANLGDAYQTLLDMIELPKIVKKDKMDKLTANKHTNKFERLP
jgi:hypothetical protein